MDELKTRFPLAPAALFEALEHGDISSLAEFWARLAPQVDTEADCSEELWQALLLTTYALDVFGEAMMTPEQAKASAERAMAYAPEATA